MSDNSNQNLLELLLDSWNRNNIILVNLLRALPDGGLEVRAIEGGPSVAELLTHIHYVRLVFVSEVAPEFAKAVPEKEENFKKKKNASGKMRNDGPQAAGKPEESMVKQA